ncbi:MAG TPA: glycosyltransferase [Nostoc sp.]|uniref:glycosyltransferase family 2 protein n=1 Tax=Nostoc sp. TaxID=1180 RepID=UPI002D4F998E|nr:glycosyltransferase [Nostoc sp.]HYX12798.1 glycosyltransferase [Nostoc sp.]
MTAKIDILIPAINNSYFTSFLIKSIKYYTKIPFSIIYIDNGSEDSEFNNVIQSLDNVNHVVIRNRKNLGFVKAINQGLKLSTAEYICFQNNDTLVFNDCFEKLISHLKNNQNLGIISPIASVGGGKQGIEIIQSTCPMFKDGTKSLDINQFSHNEINEYLYKSFKGKIIEVSSALAFFSIVMPRNTFEKIGYLDELYGLGLYEDDDYCQRIISEGLKLSLALDTYVWHLASTTFKTMYPNKNMNELLIENKKLFDKKWNN